MSIHSTRPVAASSSSVILESIDGKASAPLASFTRKEPVHDINGRASLGRAQRAEPTPFKPLASTLCAASAGHHARLVEQGVGNPTYIGSDKGGWTYFNEKTGEIGIHNLNLGHGFLGLGDFGTTCLVKKDGRIIFNGETLTRNHPETPRILAALETLLQKISDDKLPRRSFIGGNTLLPPWDPVSLHFPDYVH